MSANLSRRTHHPRLSLSEVARPLPRRSKTSTEIPSLISRIRFSSVDGAALPNLSLPLSKPKPAGKKVMTAEEYIKMDGAEMTASEYIEKFSSFESDTSDDDDKVPVGVDKHAEGSRTASSLSKSSRKLRGRPPSKSVGYFNAPTEKPGPRLSATEFGSAPPLELFSGVGSHNLLLGSAPTRLSDNYVEAAKRDELMRNGGGSSPLLYTSGADQGRVVRGDIDRRTIRAVEKLKSKQSPASAPGMARLSSRSATTSPPSDQSFETHRRTKSRPESDRSGGNTPDLSFGGTPFCPGKRLRNIVAPPLPEPPTSAVDVKKLARMLDNRHPPGMSGGRLRADSRTWHSTSGIRTLVKSKVRGNGTGGD